MTNIYLDIETIPDQRPGVLDEIRANISPPGQYKKQESIDKWMSENAQSAANDEYARGGLNGISGEICSIAWAIDGGPIEGYIRLPSESEADLLTAFFDDVLRVVQRDGEGAHTRITWIGHNVIDFDLRFLKQRCIVNDVQPPFLLPADARHGSPQVFDTMKAWAGWKGFVSQDALCKALGLPQKAGMTGADVWPAYQAGKYQEILDYNKDDVMAVIALHRRMSWG